MRASSDGRRRASSEDEPPLFASSAVRQALTPSPVDDQHQQQQDQLPGLHHVVISGDFDPVLGSLSLSSSLAHSATSASAAAAPARQTARSTRSPRPSLGPDLQERRSAFQRTFSEAPEPLPTPFTGLARLFLTGEGRTGFGRRRPRQSEKGKDGTDADALAMTATSATAAAAAAAAVAALERAEEGGAGGAGGVGGSHKGGSWSNLQQIRSRYVSNTANVGGAHDLVRHKMESIIDDPWIEDIRAQDFLMKLAVALQRYGSPVPRTEAILAALAAKLHVDGQFYLLPNLLLCSFGIDAASETHMIRCPQDFDSFRYRKVSHLVRLMLLEDEEEGDKDEEAGAPVVLHAADGAANGGGGKERPRIRTLPEAVAKLDSIINSPPLYSRAVLFVCHVVSAAGAALVFWRGDFYDAAVVAAATFFVALVIVPGSDHFFIAKVQVLLSAILTGVVGTVGSTLISSPCSKAIFYAPITIQLTGWSLTFSFMEFSMSASLIGATRMANALVVALLLGYGIQIGHDVVFSFLSPETRAGLPDWANPSQNCSTQPWYVQLAAFPFVGIPYAILLHAAPAQWPAMVLSAGGAVALVASPLSHAQEHLAVFLVALIIGVFGNIYARFTASPALIVIVNATFMIVPGSMGVTSAKAYLDDNLAQGWSTAVSMFLIAISIAAGLLSAQGLALGAASLGGWCCQHGTAAMRRQKEREKRQGPIQGGIDSVYF